MSCSLCGCIRVIDNLCTNCFSVQDFKAQPVSLPVPVPQPEKTLEKICFDAFGRWGRMGRLYSNAVGELSMFMGISEQRAEDGVNKMLDKGLLYEFKGLLYYDQNELRKFRLV